MPVFPARALSCLALGALAIGASACTPLRSHQGYVVDVDLVNSIQPGVDTRQSVKATLGNPTLTGQFGQGDWIYIARDSRALAYKTPKPTAQLTLRIRFDQNNVVQAVDKSGIELVSNIDPSKKETPTLGRKHGFFRDLFGNIGTVGAMGSSAPNQDNTGPQ